MKTSGDLVRYGLAGVITVGLIAGLLGCGGGNGGGIDVPLAQPIPSVSKSTEPAYVPSPLKTVTLEKKTPATPQTTPAECRYATKDEVSDIIGEPIRTTTVAVGGCWYLLADVAVLNTSVKVTVFRNRAAQQDEDEVPVSGLGGKAFWYDEHNLEVQLGKDVVWIDVAYIKADDKLERAKQLLALVRKRI
ncbi:hypothetical protein ACQP00_18005 [Dactylosporangium sp. CS-047395]|uniref:hypothetical protein n=1 Tax=Dactylosporangium sp. CS-047395 TaxID=3239936 RepID=UPI003D8B320E